MAMNPRLLRPLATGFDPRRIAGLQLWLAGERGVFDADVGGSPSVDGGAVGRWEDQSGNGRHFIQSVANNRPSYLTGANGRNGQPVLQFDGSNDRLTANIATFAQPNTLFLAAQNNIPPSTAPNQQHLIDGNTNRSVFYRSGATGLLFAGNNGPSVNNVWTQGTFRIIGGLFNGASSVMFVDGVASASANPGAGQFGGNGVLLGCAQGTASGFWNGNIAEVLHFNRSLSADERNAVQRYLGRKWGVTIA